MKKSDNVTISIKRKTRNRLKSKGRKGETYDEIISRLLGRKGQ